MVQYKNYEFADKDRIYGINYKKSFQSVIARTISADMVDGSSHQWLFVSISANKNIKSKRTLGAALLNIQHDIEQRVFRNKVKPENGIYDYKDYFHYYAFYETGSYENNPHCHILMRIDKTRTDWVINFLPKATSKTIRGATIDIQYVDENSIDNLVGYITKNFNHNEDSLIVPEVSEVKGKRRLI